MNEIGFLAEWALRSSILILVGAAVLWTFRVKDPGVRLAAWIAMLIGSLLIPAMTMGLPALPLHVMRSVAPPPPMPMTSFVASPGVLPAQPSSTPVAPPFNWYDAELRLYEIVAAAMLLRLCFGLAMSWRIRRRSRPTDRNFLTSRDIASPATLGIFRPVIVLPEDWPDWDPMKLDSVLAHERSHIARYDPAVQLLSAIHRALLWFSPPVWLLHSKIVRVAEEVSDDAAIAVTADRPGYAGVLVDFMQRRTLPRQYVGVPMSHYGSTDRRIQRILDSSTLSRGLTRFSFAVILLAASAVAYVTATVTPATAAAPPAPAPTSPTRTVSAPPVPSHGPGRNGGPPAGSVNGILVGLGKVEASVVAVRTTTEGSLKSVNFREGQPVHAGDIIAVVGGGARGNELEDQQRVLEILAEALESARERYAAGTIGADARNAAEEKLRLAQQQFQVLSFKAADEQVKAPISGIAGLRLVEPGNMVRPPEPIVTIAEVEPISVLFTLPENTVPRIRELFDSGKRPTVEAWNSNSSARLASGVLSGMDNQIDEKTGTIKLKATFENKDRKLYPNQFVNVKVLLK